MCLSLRMRVTTGMAFNLGTFLTKLLFLSWLTTLHTVQSGYRGQPVHALLRPAHADQAMYPGPGAALGQPPQEQPALGEPHAMVAARQQRVGLHQHGSRPLAFIGVAWMRWQASSICLLIFMKNPFSVSCTTVSPIMRLWTCRPGIRCCR